MYYLTQNIRVVLFQCVLYTKIIYILFSCIKSFEGIFYVCSTPQFRAVPLQMLSKSGGNRLALLYCVSPTKVKTP